MGTRGRKFQLQGGKTITAYLTHAVIALLYDLFYGLPCSNFCYRSVKPIEKHYYMTFIVPEILFQELLGKGSWQQLTHMERINKHS